MTVKNITVRGRGGILGVRCGDNLLISSYTLPALGRVSAKNVNKLTDLNAAVSIPGKRGASYCVTVSKHLYCMKVQLGAQQSVAVRGELTSYCVTVTGVTVRGEPCNTRST